MSAAAIPDPTFSYRRDARKLRGRFAERPAELYRSLRQLSDRYDALQFAPASDRTPTSASSQFAAEVRQCLSRRTLTYSGRQELITAAESRGISRFDANLIIAALQHRIPSPQPQARRHRIFQSRRPLLAACVVTQIALIAVAWALCH